MEHLSVTRAQQSGSNICERMIKANGEVEETYSEGCENLGSVARCDCLFRGDYEPLPLSYRLTAL